jgi:hypothetical protein
MDVRRFNWPVWAGFLLSLAAFLSYFFFFVRFPVTRDFPWANLLLFALAAALLGVGVRRAFAPGMRVKSKITGVVITTFAAAVFAAFVFVTYIVGRSLPASENAPRVGQKAPDFTLSDTSGRPTSLSALLASSVDGSPNSPGTKGVLLVFYRGYW